MGFPRRAQLTVWGIVTVFVGAVVTAAASLIARGEHDAVAEGQGRAARFVSGAEAALNRTLLGVDVLLAGTDALLRPATRPDGSLETPVANRLLLELTSRNLLVRDLVLLDGAGGVLAAAQ